MLEISTQTGGLVEVFGVDGCFRELSEAGFDAADVNLNSLFPFKDVKQRRPIPYFLTKEAGDREIVEILAPYREAVETYDLRVGQTHALFPSMLHDEAAPGDETYNAALLEGIRKMVIGTAALDCEQIVVHPFYRYYPYRESPDREWENNLKNFLALADTAKEYGVKICMENMQMPDRTLAHRIAGAANNKYEAAEYIDTLNELAGEDLFGFCLDTGHAFIGGNDLRHFIDYMGDRITCLHINDNNGREDEHLVPYMGLLPWEDVIEGLANIGYRGTLNFETVGYISRLPKAMIPSALRTIREMGDEFAKMIEK